MKGYGGSSGSGEMGPRKTWKAVCKECQSECDVPFEPKQGRDVFCSSCWKKRRTY